MLANQHPTRSQSCNRLCATTALIMLLMAVSSTKQIKPDMQI